MFFLLTLPFDRLFLTELQKGGARNNTGQIFKQNDKKLSVLVQEINSDIHKNRLQILSVPLNADMTCYFNTIL